MPFPVTDQRPLPGRIRIPVWSGSFRAVALRVVWGVLFPSALALCFLLDSTATSLFAADQPAAVTVVDDQAGAPFSFLDANGAPRGINIDIWSLWSRKTGIPVAIRLIPWSDALAEVRSGKTGVVGALFKTPAREQDYDFIGPLYSYTASIFFHRQIQGIKDAHDLTGFTVGAVQGDASVDTLRTQNPAVSFTFYTDAEELVRAATTGRIKVFIGDTPVLSHYLAKHPGGGEFRRAARPISSNDVFFAVQKGRHELAAVLREGFAQITPEEKARIFRQWEGEPVLSDIPWRGIAVSLLIVAALLGGFAVWNATLRRQIRIVTADLAEQNRILLQTQAELQGSEERYRITTEQTGQMLYDCNLTTGKVIWSGAVSAITGCSGGAFSGCTLERWMAMIHPADREYVQRCLHSVQTAGREFILSYRIVRPDTSEIYIEEHGAFLFDESGKAERMLGTFIDITERRNSEETIRQSEERLSCALNATTDGLWDMDLRTGKVFFSPHYYTMLEFRPGEFPGEYDSWRQQIYPEDLPAAESLFQSYLRGEIDQYATEFRMRTKHNGIRWILSRGSIVERDETGKPIRVVGTHVDITRQKLAEEAMRISEENLRVTLNSIGDAVIATDTGGNVTRLNAVAEQLTGWPLAEARGRALTEIFKIVNATTRQTVPCPAEIVLATGEIVGLANHTILIDRHGHEYQIADSGAPIRNDAGAVVGVVLVFRDITAEYAMREQLQQSQKMDAVGQLAGGVAHDFNNMLGGIMGAAELLEPLLRDNQQGLSYLNLMMQSSQRAADLTQKLLTFSRKKGLALETLDLHAPLRDALSLMERTTDKRIVFSVSLPDAPLLVAGDITHLQNVFLNLLINATHAISGAGTIYISSRTVYLDKLYCELSPFKLLPGEYAEVEVRDTGSGISPHILPHIFEPFFTTKEPGKGTGLGLSAVFGAVQQHNGGVNVYTEVGIGTSFHILLPRLTREKKQSEALQKTLIPGAGTILVIDDEPVMRTTACAMLSNLGYEVLLAENGRQGLAVYQENKDAIQLVILDMVMPEMNGRDCFMALKEINPNLPVVLSSGFTREEDRHILKAAGLKSFIDKPFRNVELSKVVYSALHPRNSVD